MKTQFTPDSRPGAVATLEGQYEHEETRDLVALVNDAAELIGARGEAAFSDFRTSGSRWRHDDTYIFVLDPDGNILVHPDAALEGKHDPILEDVDGRRVIRGLIDAATMHVGKTEGWYHYRWPVPEGILPRWKSSYVRLVQAPSGKSYIVASGMYNDRMERAFVVDAVTRAVEEIEKRGEAAFGLVRDPTGPFMAKDAYVFVTDMAGVELVNGAFPNLEGRDLLDLRDVSGRHVNREFIDVVRTHGAGWVDYLWPKPGDSVSTQKSAYVSGANLGETPVLVGCGVYLANAPTEARPLPEMTATELRTLVREGAAVLAERGEKAYVDFRKQGSKWFRDDTYFFVFTMDGIRAFHAAEPASEGRDDRGLLDVLGRPIVKMILEAGAGPSGEGWVHYMYPEPGTIFPAWKSAFVKRVAFPSGVQHIVGCGIYGMPMDEGFIEDVVSRAAALVEERGKAAFDRLRDKTGPFVFMDTYVFVHDMAGVELVNPAYPSLEGRSLTDLKDLKGNALTRDQIAALSDRDSAWLEGWWYRPGSNVPARKRTYVRKVQSGQDTYVVGSGIYVA